MKKLGTIITLFAITQIMICASITLWVIWYVYEKHTQQTFIELARKAYSNLEYSAGGYSTMVGGILILTFILIASIVIFIELIKTRTKVRQGVDYTSAFSHELMTPLTCINMNLETVLGKTNLSEENTNKLLKVAYKETHKLHKSIEKIIEVKRSEFYKQELKTQTINIRNYFTRLKGQLIDDYKEIELSLTFDLAPNLLFNIDEHLLMTVFSNLVENSIKYKNDKTIIDIHISHNNRKCFISFTDKGQGIEKKYLNKIFKLFFRINPNIRGSGIGLFIIKNLINLHKGKITAKSEGKGQGATFFIQLPLNKRKI